MITIDVRNENFRGLVCYAYDDNECWQVRHRVTESIRNIFDKLAGHGYDPTGKEISYNCPIQYEIKMDESNWYFHNFTRQVYVQEEMEFEED
jgi:hypothetical protein